MGVRVAPNSRDTYLPHYVSGVFTAQEIEWAEGNKSEGNPASLDPLLTEQLAQEMLIASH